MHGTAWHVNNFYVGGYRGDHHNQYETFHEIRKQRHNN